MFRSAALNARSNCLIESDVFALRIFSRRKRSSSGPTTVQFWTQARSRSVSDVSIETAKTIAEIPPTLHQLHALAVLRDVDVPAKAFFDVAGHGCGGFGFAVGQEGAAGGAGLHS